VGPLSAGFFVSSSGGNWALPFLAAAGVATLAFLVLYFLVIPEPLRADPLLPHAAPQRPLRSAL